MRAVLIIFLLFIAHSNFTFSQVDFESRMNKYLGIKERSLAYDFLVENADLINDSEKNYWLSRIHMLPTTNGKVDLDSATYYISFLTNGPTTSDFDVEVKLLLADIKLLQGDYLDCVKELEDLAATHYVRNNRRQKAAVQIGFFKLYNEIRDTLKSSRLHNEINVDEIPDEYAWNFYMEEGIFYLSRNETFKSRESFKNALRNTLEYELSKRVDAMHMLAEVEKNDGHFDKAIDIYEEVLVLEQNTDYRHGFIHTLLIYTETYIMMDQQADEIASLVDQSYHYSILLNDSLRITQACIAKGYYLNQQNNLDSAEYYLEKALSIAQIIETCYWSKSAATLLSRVHVKKGDYEKAYRHALQVQEYIVCLFEKQSNDKSELVHHVHLIYRHQEGKELAELQLKQEKYVKMVWTGVSVFSFFIIALLLYMFIKQRRRNKFLTQKALDSKTVQQLVADVSEPTKIDLDKPVFDEISKKLQWFIDDKEFRDPECSLASLAKKFDTNTTYLSKFINEESGSTFNQFINEFRILDFIEQVKSNPKESKQYTLEYLAQQSGFNSKSTFIRAFKKHTGITPSVFLKNLPNNPIVKE